MQEESSRPAATSDDTTHSLTIEAVAHQYAVSGHPRTIRTLQRYCVCGHLDCLRAPTKLGDMFLVTPESVSRHIAELDEVCAAARAATGRDQPRSAAADAAGGNQDQFPQPSTPTNDDPSRPAATTVSNSSRYVVRLEGEVEFLREQIDTKDAQIKELRAFSDQTAPALSPARPPIKDTPVGGRAGERAGADSIRWESTLASAAARPTTWSPGCRRC